ncbi:hypothetical protein Taro_055100 [Colocasia esculenta]|uniref:Uncharacterized protein n=1 Tax=Colocasia esculenta TaxID=4460 RepID=A0A843XSF7_COLES|nr:hypothetical protein [Colocasia esculenta]
MKGTGTYYHEVPLRNRNQSCATTRAHHNGSNLYQRATTRKPQPVAKHESERNDATIQERTTGS